ncbi:MAG TPA: hypothetical protein IAD08_07145 [Candidatus Scatovivens faecipullorum]|nr:hypothetical protein [Candidatus Scatovivens faecipullorum]
MGFLKKINQKQKSKNRKLEDMIAKINAQTEACRATTKAIEDLSKQAEDDYHEFTQELNRLIQEKRADEIPALIEKHKKKQHELQEKFNQFKV